jgi:hypothetical protein
MEATHWTDVSALVGAAFTSREREAVHSDRLKGEFDLASDVAAISDDSVSECIQ